MHALMPSRPPHDNRTDWRRAQPLARPDRRQARRHLHRSMSASPGMSQLGLTTAKQDAADLNRAVLRPTAGGPGMSRLGVQEPVNAYLRPSVRPAADDQELRRPCGRSDRRWPNPRPKGLPPPVSRTLLLTDVLARVDPAVRSIERCQRVRILRRGRLGRYQPVPKPPSQPALGASADTTASSRLTRSSALFAGRRLRRQSGRRKRLPINFACDRIPVPSHLRNESLKLLG